MADVQLRNESDYNFADISSEEWRRYVFVDGDEAREVTIKDPQWLGVSDSGHRIVDGDEISHYVPYGWKHLQWCPAEGEPHFVR